MFIRLLVSPPLPPTLTEELRRRYAGAGVLLACLHDDDVHVTAVTLRAAETDVQTTVNGIFERLSSAIAVGRAFRLELLYPDPKMQASDEVIRAIAVDAHGKLCAPVFVARVAASAGKWKSLRPITWGADGLVVTNTAAALPYGGSESAGIAIEIGAPTLIMKTRVNGINASQAERIAHALSGDDSGLVDLGAYAVEAASDSCFLVLEAGDPHRTPLHRALKVIEIEARRFGGRLGSGSMLSHVPLPILLDALAGNIGLHAQSGQVIETHLPAPASGS